MLTRVHEHSKAMRGSLLRRAARSLTNEFSTLQAGCQATLQHSAAGAGPLLAGGVRVGLQLCSPEQLLTVARCAGTQHAQQSATLTASLGTQAAAFSAQAAREGEHCALRCRPIALRTPAELVDECRAARSIHFQRE